MNATVRANVQKGPAVSDNTPWQSPSGPTQPVTPPTPYSAVPAFPPPTAQEPGFPPAAPTPTGAPAQPTAGWTPPPKPGLIPLRPLTLGTILGASFQVLRRNPRPTFGFALIITGVITVASMFIIGFVAFAAFARTSSAIGSDAEAIAAGAFATVALAGLIPAALILVGTAILQGIIALEVARGTLGEKHRLGGLWRTARGRIGALIGWSLLVAAAIIIAIAIVAIIIGLLVAFGGTAGAGVGVLLGILVGLGGTVLFAWLGTKLSLVPSVLMLERLPLRDAVIRSWSLTNNYFWKTFGILILVAFILNTVSSIVSTPLSLVASYGGFLINPNGSIESMAAFSLITTGLLLVITILFGAVTAVVQSAVPALLYIDLRMRKEGLDLELTRFVEARQAGDASVADPYLVKSGSVAAPTAAQESPWS